MLSGYETGPRCQLPTCPKLSGITDAGIQRGSRNRTNSRNGLQVAGDIRLSGMRLDLMCHIVNMLLQLLQMLPLRNRSKDALREVHYTKRSSTRWRGARN